MKNKLSIAVLITNYNTWDLTKRCIDKLLVFSENVIEQVVVIDDASSEKCVYSFPTKIKIIKNVENKGYVASVNIGFKEIKEDIVVLLDSDAYPLMDIFSPLEQLFLQNEKLGALSFHLVDENNKPTGNGCSQPNFLQLILGQYLYRKMFLTKQNSDTVVLFSCGVAIRRKAFESVDGFDEDFDFLDGDIDFFMRLSEKGWKLSVSDKLVAFHKGSGSPQSTAKRVVRFHRNRYKLLKKHKLLPVSFIIKIILFGRHLCEFLLLQFFGRLIVKDTSFLADKKKSRWLLLKSVWNNYELKSIE